MEKDKTYVNLNDPDKGEIKQFWLNIVRSKAREDNREDIIMASDEDLLMMFPLSLLDYEALQKSLLVKEWSNEDIELFYQLNGELDAIKEDEEYCEKALNDPKIHYLQKSEFQADLLYAVRRKNELVKQIEGLKDKYDGRNNAISKLSKK